MSAVSVHDASTAPSRPIDRALAGEKIVVTRKGEPVARLVPVAEKRRPRESGALRGELEVPDGFFALLPGEVPEAFHGEEGREAVERPAGFSWRRRDARGACP